MLWFVITLALLFITYRYLSSPVEKQRSDTDSIEIDDEALLEEKDNWETFDLYSAKLLPATGRYKISYQDQTGLKTERIIRVKRVHESLGEYAIDAHCELRNAHRTFINSRVQKVVNVDTGEVVSSLANHALAQYQESGEGQVLAAIEKNWLGVAILIFVCRADGQMRKEERNIVAEYLNKCSLELELDAFELDRLIKTIGDVDYREFKKIVTSLKKVGEIDSLKLILGCAEKIVATQKIIDPMEKVALDFISEAVNS